MQRLLLPLHTALALMTEADAGISNAEIKGLGWGSESKIFS